LQARFPNLHVRITVSGEIDATWDGERGHITREMIERFVPDLRRGPIMLCGPDAMMTAMRSLFVAIGVPDVDIHQEAFVSPPTPAAGEPEPELVEVAEGARNLRFERAGKDVDLTNGTTVLEAAEECGVAIPFECRSGICGQCKTKLISGRVVMAVQDALTRADKQKGLILACQARAVKDTVVDA
jgi:ferredoxin